MGVDKIPDSPDSEETGEGFGERDKMLAALSPSDEALQPDQQSFDHDVVEAGRARIGVNPEGAYVSSWQVKNAEGEFVDVLYTGQTQKRTGIPLLFPYYGDAEGMRSHGFGRDSGWESTVEGNRISMTLTSDEIPDEARNEYPYPFEAAVVIEAEEDGSMVYSLKVTNKGDTVMPLSPGLHPYFAVAHGDKSQIEIDGIDGFDAEHTDWDNSPPDTPYGYSGVTSLKLPDKTITIEDVTEGGAVVKYIVVWSQNPESGDYEFVCVEPVCGLDNGVIDDPINVEPGESFSMKLRFGVTLNETQK